MKIYHWVVSLRFLRVVAGVALVIYFSSLITIVSYPSDGLRRVLPDGTIAGIYIEGAAFGKLQDGDRILTVDGVAWNGPVSGAGEQYQDGLLEFVVERNGELLTIEIVLARPGPLEWIERLVPLFVSAVYWLAGVLSLRRTGGEEDQQSFAGFFWLCITASILLASGGASYNPNSWLIAVYICAFWFIGPAALHLHLWFPIPRPEQFWRRMCQALFAVAGVGTGLFALWWFSPVRSDAFSIVQFFVLRVLILVNLLLIVIILRIAYRTSNVPGLQSKVRLIALGTFVSVIPFLGVQFLPDLTMRPLFLSQSLGFLFLGLWPLVYLYGLNRLYLMKWDRIFQKVMGALVAGIALSAVYLGLNALLEHGPIIQPSPDPAKDLGIALLTLILLLPVQKAAGQMVNGVLYGERLNTRVQLNAFSAGLNELGSLQEMADELARRLAVILQASWTGVALLANGRHNWIEGVQGQKPEKWNSTGWQSFTPDAEFRWLTPVIPVRGREQNVGWILLGARKDGELYSEEDLNALELLARQVAPLVENFHYLAQLKAYNEQLEQLVVERTSELYEAQQRAEAILANVGDGVMVTDLTGKIQDVNAAFEELSGFQSSEVIGEAWWGACQRDAPPACLIENAKADRETQAWRLELNLPHKNGQSYDVVAHVTPLRESNGAIWGYVASVKNVTAQRVLEQQKNQFIADVSHELRTPLTNLLLYLDFLEHSKGKNFYRYLEILQGQSALLVDLLESVTHLFQIAALHATRTDFPLVEINKIVLEAVEQQKAKFEQSGILFQVDLLPETLRVQGHQTLLRHLVLNLLSNARIYTREGRVWVRTYREGGRVCLQVQDTGMGIAEQDLPYIYARFYRGRDVRQSQIPGAGLGLSIVKEIANMHGGEITVTSRRGEGSTFVVCFPGAKDP